MGTDFATGQIIISEGADLTDGMLITVDTGGAVVVSTTLEALAEYVQSEDLGDLPLSKVVTQAIATIGVGGITGAQTPALTITGTVLPATAYTPTAAQIYAASLAVGLGIGSQYQARIANLMTTTGVLTMGANTGVTLSGLATLTGVNSFGTWNIEIVSATAVTMTRVG